MRGNVITVATLFTSSLWGVQQHTPSALIKKLSEAYVETSYSQQITESDAMKLLFVIITIQVCRVLQKIPPWCVIGQYPGIFTQIHLLIGLIPILKAQAQILKI